ncbi:hypothetical protein PVAP13_1NG241719 [Panicum virgatum]|uniref:Uncharacterized protein n=1 Tax=Panicum virgatum TaxID=38727 RepID=A0A8T0X5N7_PANVG|nr:hypothetical protein PVAP13_1NG241719 [Panicum virgatum]
MATQQRGRANHAKACIFSGKRRRKTTCVILFFHGGSFAHSSSSTAIYDNLCRRFVKLSKWCCPSTTGAPPSTGTRAPTTTAGRRSSGPCCSPSSAVARAPSPACSSPATPPAATSPTMWPSAPPTPGSGSAATPGVQLVRAERAAPQGAPLHQEPHHRVGPGPHLRPAAG